jgi:hypothetical protein
VAAFTSGSQARGVESPWRVTAIPGAATSVAYPSGWHLTTRRLDRVIDPHTIAAVSSYPLPGGPVDDCDGTHARGRPANGALVVIKEVLDGASLRKSLPRLRLKSRHTTLPSSGRAGCLPPVSVAYQFKVGVRAFTVWVSVGARARTETRTAVERIIGRLAISPHR